MHCTHFNTQDVAVAMARSAYRQAVQLSAVGRSVVGVGATCALRTNREKKGDHKVYVFEGSIRTWTGGVLHSLHCTSLHDRICLVLCACTRTPAFVILAYVM